MTRLMVLGITAIMLASCALRPTYLTTPIVDMHGVDQARYNNDLSDCQALKVKRTADTIWTADVISNCMTERGYHVLQSAG
jgi:hypothetical protein